ncbi:hypothetical protein ACFL08_04160 [Patescibacteria group bacterium]
MVKALRKENSFDKWQASKKLCGKSVYFEYKKGCEFYYCSFSTVHKKSLFPVSIGLIIECDFRSPKVDFKREHLIVVEIKNFHRSDVNASTKVEIEDDSDAYESIREFVEELLDNVEDKYEKNTSALSAFFNE